MTQHKEVFDDIPVLETGIYQHYKGNYYEVLGVGCNTETHEYVVVYRPLYYKPQNPRMWVRPHAMFFETVELDGKQVPRFAKVESDS